MGISTLSAATTKGTADYVNEVLTSVRAKNPAEPEFHQAVQEVLESLGPALSKHPEYQKARILERMVEPGRRSGQRPGESRIPHSDEQRHRPV